MSEYTYADVIIDPNDERLEGAIGKEVYFANLPLATLENANSKVEGSELKKVYEYNSYPFFTERGGYSACIILKKEPKVKYVPFDLSKQEDRDALRGKWVKAKISRIEYQITVMSKNRAISLTGSELFSGYTFLDGSPVGKKVEE